MAIRPPRTTTPAVGREAVAQPLGLDVGELAFQAEQPGPGQKVGGDAHRGESGRVDGEAV